VTLPETASRPALLPFVLEDQLHAAKSELEREKLQTAFAASTNPSLAPAAAKAEAAFELEQAEAGRVAADQDPKKLQAAEQALAAARKRMENPGDHYTPIRATLKAQDGPEDKGNADFQRYPETSTGRRLALARWIVDQRNPLTARVLVNHVWTRHFSASLVPDVSDFGLRCPPPLHQDVLDALAIDFMRHGWSLKHLHRTMVLSRLYRRSSSNAGAVPPTLAADPENNFYWRMNPHRLESQAVRDSVLAVSGRLDRRIGGPSVDQETSLRRALYFRQTADSEQRFLAAFDNSNVLECYRRQESIVPQQALALANSRLTRECADEIAKQTGSLGDADFIGHAFLRLLNRAPTKPERDACIESLAEFDPAPCEPGPLRPPPGIDEPQRFRDHPMTPDTFARRGFLGSLGSGLAGIALQALLARESNATIGQPAFAPKAKRVIWLFMRGGVSHMESFDPKPMLTKYAGKSIAETPYKSVQDPEKLKKVRVVVVNDANGKQRNVIYPLQVGFKRYGQCGVEISDWFPNIGSRADEIAFIRGMWTTDDNHGAQVQFAAAATCWTSTNRRSAPG